jgi:hypothetical protein
LHSGIQLRIDHRRGCGWRKSGGLYLISEGLAAPCGRLPIPLEVCPSCGAGFKPSRGWTWLDADAFLKGHPCKPPDGECNVHCPLSVPFGRVGLLWIGEQFYPTPEAFIREADRLGISRRINAMPKGFIVGRTWVWLAHRKGICIQCGTLLRFGDGLTLRTMDAQEEWDVRARNPVIALIEKAWLEAKAGRTGGSNRHE